MFRTIAAAALAASLTAGSALAAQDKDPGVAAEKAPTAEKAQPRLLMDRDPDAMDVAKTPTTDLNITKEEIPAVLVRATSNPYDLAGLRQCTALAGAVEELDAILGPDMDLPQQERDRISAGRVAKTVVNSFIPFRGLIREFSGANDHDRQVRAAIQAGLARRGFLKGVGAARKCAYPAGPATPQVIAAYNARIDAADRADRKAREKSPEIATAEPASAGTAAAK